MSTSHSRQESGTPAAPRPTILIVDDDPNILSSLRRLLHGYAYDILTANSPVSAIGTLNQREVTLIITDYLMPEMNGIELLTQVRQKWPDTIGIMITGVTDIRVAADAVNRHLVDYFITKPWENHSFLELIVRAMDTWLDTQPLQTAPKGANLDVDTFPRPFGKYQLIGRMAYGGMAEILCAKLCGVGNFEKRLVIKKVLPHLAKDENFIKMFMDEAVIMSSLNHSNIVSVVDFGETSGEHFLVMEYVDGMDLATLLEKAGKKGLCLPVSIACHIAIQVCQGLQHAHHKTNQDGGPLHIVHRDINTRNILVSVDGEVKIADFGIARSVGRRYATEVGLVKGTLSYMSPEQISGLAVDGRSDLYSLGVVLYEMLTGKLPFSGATQQETITAILQGSCQAPHRVNPKVNDRLAKVVQKALAKSPSQRFHSANEMNQAISGYLQDAGLHPDANSLSEFLSRV